MKVTRDVILDLWPVYEAGEASADTRALIEQFLQDDPEFARLLREEDGAGLSPARVPLSRDHEMETLRRAQKLVTYRQSSLLLAALCFMLAVILRYGRQEILYAAGGCLVWWLVLVFYGRRIYKL